MKTDKPCWGQVPSPMNLGKERCVYSLFLPAMALSQSLLHSRLPHKSPDTHWCSVYTTLIFKMLLRKLLVYALFTITQHLSFEKLKSSYTGL